MAQYKEICNSPHCASKANKTKWFQWVFEKT
jgi:hypothetical protein